MAQSWQVSVIDLKIALIAYLLSLAMFIPISGWLADKYGAKKIFIFAITVFTLSSACCGFAINLSQLVLARFCQGIGGALALPVGRLIILRSFDRKHFIQIMNHTITLGAIGLILGPVIGGLITHYFSWHWIFWVNIPIGIMAINYSKKIIPSLLPLKPEPLDIFGFLYFGLGLAGINFGLSALTESNLSTKVGLSFLGLGALLLLIYQQHSKHRAHPIINLELFDFRTFRVSILSNFFIRMGLGGIPFILPLLFQINLNYSPQLSGLLLAPLALGVLISKQFIVRLLRLLRYKKLLILNTCVSSLLIASFGLISPTTPLVIIMGMTAFYGFLIAIQYGAMNSLAFADMPAEKLSAATSIISTIQQIAIGMGVAISGILLTCFSKYLAPSQTLTLEVFGFTFAALGMLTLFSIIFFIPLQAGDGDNMVQA